MKQAHGPSRYGQVYTRKTVCGVTSEEGVTLVGLLYSFSGMSDQKKSSPLPTPIPTPPRDDLFCSAGVAPQPFFAFPAGQGKILHQSFGLHE